MSKRAGRFSVLALAVLVAFVIMPVVSYGGQKTHKEMKLTMAAYIPVGYPYIYKGTKIFPDLVNESGKGIVRIDEYWGGTLLKGKQLLPGLQAGTADIINLTGAYLLGTFPIVGVQILPVWDNVASSYEGLKIGNPLAELQNDILKEKNLYQLATAGMAPEFLWTRKKLVRKPADMKGLKIRCAGKVEAKVLQALGAAPVVMPSAELPQALQRGVVDGALMNPWSASGRGIEEFCKYMLVLPLSSQTTPYFVLWDKWNSWPEDVRKVLTDVAKEWEGKYCALKGAVIYDAQLQEELIPFYKKKGMEAIYPTKEEARAFQQVVRPVVDWWVKQVGEDVGKKALTYTDYKY
jgi:TRAP-type C4-dicarboxylate transport system substrate-binding protein